jgi:hypothetical protein
VSHENPEIELDGGEGREAHAPFLILLGVDRESLHQPAVEGEAHFGLAGVQGRRTEPVRERDRSLYHERERYGRGAPRPLHRHTVFDLVGLAEAGHVGAIAGAQVQLQGERPLGPAMNRDERQGGHEENEQRAEPEPGCGQAAEDSSLAGSGQPP